MGFEPQSPLLLDISIYYHIILLSYICIIFHATIQLKQYFLQEPMEGDVDDSWGAAHLQHYAK